MTALVFIALMAFSVVLAFMAKRGVIADSMDDVMVAGRSFGAFMVFFVTVGETYGIGTMIGVPVCGSSNTNGALPETSGKSWLVHTFPSCAPSSAVTRRTRCPCKIACAIC